MHLIYQEMSLAPNQYYFDLQIASFSKYVIFFSFMSFVSAQNLLFDEVKSRIYAVSILQLYNEVELSTYSNS
jgi:hypothetical protein